MRAAAWRLKIETKIIPLSQTTNNKLRASSMSKRSNVINTENYLNLSPLISYHY